MIIMPTKQVILTVIIAVVITALILTAIMGIAISFIIKDSAKENQRLVWDKIAKDGANLRNLYSNATQKELKNWLPEGKMNFTEGLVWESKHINWSYDRPPYENVTQVLKNGLGACGEHVWVYAAFCVAQDIPFRVIKVGYYETGIVDHSWIQVNPSFDNKTWVTIEVAGICNNLDEGKTINQLWTDFINNDLRFFDANGNRYKMVLAYQLNGNNEVIITDVTKTFLGLP
jgi:predicted small secreted protein